MKKGEFLPEFKMLILIGVGGFLGATMRYYMSGLARGGDFPHGTLLVNILGSFILGFFLFSSFYSGFDSPEIRGFLAIGFTGSIYHHVHILF